MSDKDTLDMFGVKNELDNDVMWHAMNTEMQIWDFNLNHGAEKYIPILHDCQGFIKADVSEYQVVIFRIFIPNFPE